MHHPWITLAACFAAATSAAAQPTAGELAREVCAGKTPSVQLVADALARAKARPELNAFVTIDEAGAMAVARRADAAKGKACKPLQGVPIVIKDNIEVAGLPTTGGTPALKGYLPKADAPVAKKLRDAGAIVIAKTNMHELAFGISGFNPAYNTGKEPGVRNAYDVTKAAGGSSSGDLASSGRFMTYPSAWPRGTREILWARSAVASSSRVRAWPASW